MSWSSAKEGSPQNGRIVETSGGIFKYLSGTATDNLKWFMPVPASGVAAAPDEQYKIVFPPLYGFIGDPASYDGKNDDNENDNDDVLEYTPLVEEEETEEGEETENPNCSIRNFNFTKLGLAHKVGDTLKPIPVITFADIEDDLLLLPEDYLDQKFNHQQRSLLRLVTSIP